MKNDLTQVPASTGSSYPPPFDEPCRGRSGQRLGLAAGLTRFGVNAIGTRDDADWGEYPDIDLRFTPSRYDRAGGAGGGFAHKDGTPY